MKGQYLPLETVLSIGLGLILAIGSVTAFNTLRKGILDTGEENQVELIQSKVSDAIYSLSTLNKQSKGQIKLTLPESISGTSYTVALTDGTLKINIQNKLYQIEYNQLKHNYSFRGTVQGGQVKIVKTQNNLIITSQ
ncbi:MAG: hypothetical protein ABEI78_01480 [Candidatus Nanohaloarchaea archaeon]